MDLDQRLGIMVEQAPGTEGAADQLSAEVARINEGSKTNFTQDGENQDHTELPVMLVEPIQPPVMPTRLW